MKIQKYIDMAYGNPRGIEWLNLLHKPQMWYRWSKKVLEHTAPRWIPDRNRPEKILTAAIWHFGYANDSPSSEVLRRTARRLRRGGTPLERGVGALKGDLRSLNADFNIYGMPREFWLLDNFLEHEIRPLMDSLTKATE